MLVLSDARCSVYCSAVVFPSLSDVLLRVVPGVVFFSFTDNEQTPQIWTTCSDITVVEQSLGWGMAQKLSVLPLLLVMFVGGALMDTR